MKHWDTVAVVGVGLIGGSIGLALRGRGLAKHVVGIGRRASSLKAAQQCGAVTHTTTNLPRGVADAQVVVVCTPIETIAEKVRECAEHCPTGTLITDAGSTKAQIVSALDGQLPREVAFVGSHPLAGSEQTGPQNARADLFDGRLVVVTPTRRTEKSRLAEVERFWTSLGASVTRMSATEHDQAVAAISHLPHLVASALAASTPEKQLPLAATGWLDTTRIAAGDVQLWRQILADNRGHVLKSLDKFEKVLSKFRAALETDNGRALLKLLEAGKHNRDSVGS